MSFARRANITTPKYQRVLTEAGENRSEFAWQKLRCSESRERVAKSVTLLSPQKKNEIFYLIAVFLLNCNLE